MLNVNGIFNLLVATSVLAAQDGDEMTGKVLGLVAAGPPTEATLPLALRFARTASEGSLSPRVRSALETLIMAVESIFSPRFKVRLLDPGSSKINVIKVLRGLADLSLGDARALAENVPSDIKVFERLANAEEALAQLVAVGCRAEIISEPRDIA